jgi:hypothetical protein
MHREQEDVNQLLYPVQEQLPELEKQAVPDCVYHYTDAAGVLGIMRSRQIWATDYRFLNDSAEILYTTQLAQEVARREFLGGQSGLGEKFVEYVSSAARPDVYEKTPYYLACFSEADNSLSQWRAYGGSQGYALRLPGDLSTSAEYQHDGRQNPGITLLKVVYERNFHESYVRTLIGLLIRICEAPVLAAIHEKEGSEVALARFLPFFWGQIDRASYRFKHPDFAVEKEWRLVAWGDVHREMYRAGSDLVPYIEMPVWASSRPGVPMPITAVLAGPNPYPERTLHALGRALTSHGYDEADCQRLGSDTPARI